MGRGREGSEGEGKVGERGVRVRLGYLSRCPRVPSYATDSNEPATINHWLAVGQ